MTNIDLNQAVNLRENDRCTLAIVKDGELIYKSSKNGILPLYLAYENKIDAVGACAADKVVGKGAAMIFAALKVSELNTIIISKPALKYLQDNNIVVTYSKLVDYISNRTKDGKCPVETMAEASSEFEAFLDDARQFLKRLELI